MASLLPVSKTNSYCLPPSRSGTTSASPSVAENDARMFRLGLICCGSDTETCEFGSARMLQNHTTIRNLTGGDNCCLDRHRRYLLGFPGRQPRGPLRLGLCHSRLRVVARTGKQARLPGQKLSGRMAISECVCLEIQEGCRWRRNWGPVSRGQGASC